MTHIHINNLPTESGDTPLELISGQVDEVMQQAIARAQDTRKIVGGQTVDLKQSVLTGYVGPIKL